MNTRRLIYFSLCLIAAFGVGFLIAKRMHHGERGMVVRSYDVPPGRGEEIRNLINKIFASEKQDGSAQIFDSRLLIVKAPQSYQNGIHHFIERAGQDKAPKRASIQFDYWLVRGETARESNADLLLPLKSVLSEIIKTHGPRKFHLLEHLNFTSLTNRETRLKGPMAEVKTVAMLVNDQIELFLKLNTQDSLGEIETITRVKSGQFLVLGENSMQPNAKSIAEGKQQPEGYQLQREIYHIVRAESL